MGGLKGLTVGVLDLYEHRLRRQLLKEFADMTLRFAQGASDQQRLEAAREAEVLLAGWSAVGPEIIAASAKLRLIHKLGVGVDRIDLDAARSRKVTVLRAAGINAVPVAEMTVLLMLAVLRELPWAVDELRHGRFQKEVLRDRTIQLAGQRVGLVGFGHIGQAVARRLAAFDVEIAYADPAPGRTADPGVAVPMELDDLVAWADIVSLHAPLLPETQNLMDSSRIARMRPGAILVNTARGGLVDDEALADAISAGQLRGAGLDVTAIEPLPADSRLLGLQRVVVTPHIGGAVATNFLNVARRARQNVTAYFAGQPIPADDLVI